MIAPMDAADDPSGLRRKLVNAEEEPGQEAGGICRSKGSSVALM
jgi:hypothetical protein